MKDIAFQVEQYMNSPEIKAQFEKDLADIIAIPSVSEKTEGKYVFGENCAKVLEKVLEMGESYGFKAQNHEYYCGSLVMGEGEKEVGIVSHLDVVPCGGGWSVEPYALTVKDNLYMGRGTEDDKGPMLISMYALRFLMDKGIKLPFAVRMILGCDEEVGSTDLRYFASKHKAPDFSFTPDSSFPVCIGEKDIFSFHVDMGELDERIQSITAGTAVNSVADKAVCVVKGELDAKSTDKVTVSVHDGLTEITAIGKGAHASMPENSENAVLVLCQYLADNKLFNGGWVDFLKTACSEYKGETFGIAKTDKDFGYLTCTCGLLYVKEGRLKAAFNVRSIPSVTHEKNTANIQKSLEKYGFTACVGDCSKGYMVSSDDPKIKALTNACETVLGYECKPYTMGGGTYARSLENTVAFGATITEHRGQLGEGKGGAHERDEYLSREEVIKATQIIVLSMLGLKDVYTEE